MFVCVFYNIYIVYVFVFMFVFEFTKLHITTQFGRVIVVILCCYSHWSSREGPCVCVFIRVGSYNFIC